VTIREVARRAGVSTATVSRVMSGSTLPIAPATRRRVLAAVAALGYAPNWAAKSLRTLQSHKLLVLVPDLSNPFFAQILQGIEDAAQRRGYAVLVGDTQDDVGREEAYALMLSRREADGMIFLGYRLPKGAQGLLKGRAKRRPAIVNGCEFSPKLRVPSVHIDNVAAAREAMDHLYGLGHRRIAVVTGPLNSPLSQDRLRGAEACAEVHGAADELIVVPGDFSVEAGAAAADAVLGERRPPTAAFCFSDQMAMGFLDAARRRGLTVPRDLSIVGFDDIKFARYLDPPLTTVAQPMREIGEHCVGLLVQMLSGPVPRPVSMTLPHQFTVRGSTAPPKKRRG